MEATLPKYSNEEVVEAFHEARKKNPGNGLVDPESWMAFHLKKMNNKSSFLELGLGKEGEVWFKSKIPYWKNQTKKISLSSK